MFVTVTRPSEELFPSVTSFSFSSLLPSPPTVFDKQQGTNLVSEQNATRFLTYWVRKLVGDPSYLILTLLDFDLKGDTVCLFVKTEIQGSALQPGVG
ncbi:hypothetical protein BY996DRAFT_6546774 [Phakopsora pachyrhizi]|nr:hypothetical protein BY996DRAFT_6546774 [Phakopsora pachyrhizi]